MARYRRAWEMLTDPNSGKRGPWLVNASRKVRRLSSIERARIGKRIKREERKGVKPKQAIAIALSEARQRGAPVPARRRRRSMNLPRARNGRFLKRTSRRARRRTNAKSSPHHYREAARQLYHGVRRTARRTGAGIKAGISTYRATNPRRRRRNRRPTVMATRRRRTRRARANPVRRRRRHNVRRRARARARNPVRRRRRHNVRRRARARHRNPVRRRRRHNVSHTRRRRRRNAYPLVNARRRRRRNTHRMRRHNRGRIRRRNPFSTRGIVASILDGVTVGLGAFGGYASVKNLDGLYTLPFLQTTNVPGTTATVGDTLQSVLDATLVTVASHMAMRKGGRRMAQFFGGAIAGAWLSVIHDLVASWTSAPAFVQHALSGYPRGMGAIAPGSTYMPALTAGPVFAPQARMAGYPVIAPGRGF